MSQAEREKKRQQAALEQQIKSYHEQRKLQLRPIARMVRAICRNPGYWRTA